VTTASARTEWWGTYEVELGRADRFRIGPLVLTVLRLPHEWQVHRELSPDPDEASVKVELGRAADEPSPAASVTRYATASTTSTCRIVPVLPDRTVVTRPERPLTILPQTEVVLYVGSPVWVRLLQSETELLGDLPVSTPKEAWLGPSTMEGEACYATRTLGRLQLDTAILRPHRVVTAVSIQNGTDTPFVCRQVNLPVRQLSVYASPEGRLWTEAVTLERTSATGFAKLHVGQRPPPAASNATLVSGPRDTSEHGNLFRAFGTLFD
jgi:hypothetical protein